LTNHILINHTSVFKNEREKDEERRRKKEKKRKTTKIEQKIHYFLFYLLSFACFSPISFIIFFSVLPAIWKKEQDRKKLRKNFFFFFFFFPVVVPWVGGYPSLKSCWAYPGAGPGYIVPTWIL
jgi:polyferredoxin